MTLYQDEHINELADYFMMRKDLHGVVTLEQFIKAPVRYKWIPPVCEEEELEIT